MDFLLLLMVLAIRAAPNFFFEYVLYNPGKNDPPMPLTGHQVARRLLDRAGATDVKIVDEPADAPAFDDHYDPENKQVALSPGVAGRQTVAAYAIAAHEVGHALQHREGDERFRARTISLKVGIWLQYGMFVLLLPAIVFPTAFREHGGLGVLQVVLVLFTVAMLVIRGTTLSTEWDASFGRGLPMLTASGLLPGTALPRARMILFAAATTYFGVAVLTAIWAWLALAELTSR